METFCANKIKCDSDLHDMSEPDPNILNLEHQPPASIQDKLVTSTTLTTSTEGVPSLLRKDLDSKLQLRREQVDSDIQLF